MTERFSLNLFLPGLVRPKGRARIPPGGKGVPYTPQATRAYEAALSAVAADAMGGCDPVSVPLAVALIAVLPIPKSWPAWKRQAANRLTLAPTGKPDMDNLLKTIDALNGIVWVDDSYVVEAVVRKRYGTRPGLHLMIRALPRLPAQGSKQADLEALE